MKALFCYDGSELSEQLLAAARKLFQDLKLQATVLHVVPEVNERYRHLEWLHEKELKEIEHMFGDEGEEIQAVNRARAILAGLGMSVERKVRSGDPTEEILAEAATGGYDLIVMGSHSKSALEEFFLGSVSKTVADRSPVSVLIVKPGSRS